LAHCQSPREKIESLRSKISEAQQEIQLKRKEAKENIERHAKAKWVISLSIHRVIYIDISSWFSVFGENK
jgi:glutamine synthetase